jgi:hypothetical protein
VECLIIMKLLSWVFRLSLFQHVHVKASFFHNQRWLEMPGKVPTFRKGPFTSTICLDKTLSSRNNVALQAVPGDSVAESTLWFIRGASAVASYVGFVGYFDRPRGQLEALLNGDIEIKASTVPGAGLGLFAKTSLPKGTILGTYPGAVIPLSQNLGKLQEYPACEGYIWRFSDNRAVIDPTNAEGILDATCLGGNRSMPGSILLFQSLLRPLFSVSTALCRINEPPRGRDVNVVTSEHSEKRLVVFELERDVMAGEEFFIDYGLSYDRSRYMPK